MQEKHSKPVAVWAMTALLALAAPLRGAPLVSMESGLGNPYLIAETKQTTFLKVSLTGFPVLAPERRTPVNVALLIDRSGSMSGEKLDKAKEAAVMAVRRLGPDDIVSVIAYQSTVEVVVPATKLTEPEDVIAKIRTLQSGGSTALFAGVGKGAAEVRKFLDRNRVNRVILLSDGLANVGPASPGELERLGRSLGREQIAVSTIGLGTGYNEDLMTRLAFASDGNHAFARTADDLVAIFDREFRDVLSVVAQEITVTVTCEPGVRPVRVVGREADITGNRVGVYLNQLYAEQEKYVILEVEIAGGKVGDSMKVAEVAVVYANMATRTEDRLTASIGARFTDSPKVAEENLNREVMVDAYAQVANEWNDKAVELRDKGDVMAANKLLLSNAGTLEQNAKLLGSEELGRMADENYRDAETVTQDRYESVGRKDMRERQHLYRTQQQR